MRVEGTAAVVTGAGGGIGESIAATLHRAGARVAVVDIDRDAAQQVAESLDPHGRTAFAVQTDVSSYEDVASLADTVFDRFGSVEILCNNAGVTLRPFRALWDNSLDDISFVLGVNFWGVVHGLKAFVPRMLAQNRPTHVVNTSSGAAVRTIAGHSAYTASKMAVDGLSHVLRAETADKSMGVTILYPGPVRTRIGTSERLRPETERSETRSVEPFHSDFLDRGRVESQIEPGRVGIMVLDAIQNDEPFIFTHGAPADEIRARTEEMIAADRIGPW